MKGKRLEKHFLYMIQALGSRNRSALDVAGETRRNKNQCSQPSEAPVGPGGGTAKSPGRDGTGRDGKT